MIEFGHHSTLIEQDDNIYVVVCYLMTYVFDKTLQGSNINRFIY